MLFNTAKNGRDFEALFGACALSSPVTFLTADHVYKSDLTRPDLAFGFVNKSSGYEIRFVLSFTFLVSPCSRLVFSCLEFCLFLSCLVSCCLVSSCPVLSSLMSSRSVLPCSVLSCLVLSCPLLSCPVGPILSCPVLSCLVLSWPVLSCVVLSCPVLSHLVSSRFVWSCPVLANVFEGRKSTGSALFAFLGSGFAQVLGGGEGGGIVSKSVSIKTKQYKVASVKAF